MRLALKVTMQTDGLCGFNPAIPCYSGFGGVIFLKAETDIKKKNPSTHDFFCALFFVTVVINKKRNC